MRVQNFYVDAFGRTTKGECAVIERLAVDAIDSALVVAFPEGVHTVQVQNRIAISVLDGQLGREQQHENDQPCKQNRCVEGFWVDFSGCEQIDGTSLERGVDRLDYVRSGGLGSMQFIP